MASVVVVSVMEASALEMMGCMMVVNVSAFYQTAAENECKERNERQP